MTEEDRLRKIARETSRQTLSGIGIDPDSPSEMQAMMQTLREVHAAKKTGRTAFVWTVITVTIGGLASLLWTAITRGSGHG